MSRSVLTRGGESQGRWMGFARHGGEGTVGGGWAGLGWSTRPHPRQLARRPRPRPELPCCPPNAPTHLQPPCSSLLSRNNSGHRRTGRGKNAAFRSHVSAFVLVLILTESAVEKRSETQSTIWKTKSKAESIVFQNSKNFKFLQTLNCLK